MKIWLELAGIAAVAMSPLLAVNATWAKSGCNCFGRKGASLIIL